MKLSVVLLAAACASCTGITVAPERPKARLERSSAVLALRGGEGGALTLPKLALGANIATWGFYGANPALFNIPRGGRRAEPATAARESP